MPSYLGLLTLGTSAGSEYGYLSSLPILVSQNLGINQTTSRIAHLKFKQILTITVLLCFILIDINDD